MNAFVVTAATPPAIELSRTKRVPRVPCVSTHSTPCTAPHLLGREHQRVPRVPCVSTHSTPCTAPHLLGREHQRVPEPIGPEAQDLFIHSAVSHAITGSNARKHWSKV